MAFSKCITTKDNFYVMAFKNECQFILEATNECLFQKVVLVFGSYGVRIRNELLKVTVNNIED